MSCSAAVAKRSPKILGMAVGWRRIRLSFCLLLAVVGVATGRQLLEIDASRMRSTEIPELVTPQHGSTDAETRLPSRASDLRRSPSRADREQDHPVETSWKLVVACAMALFLAVRVGRPCSPRPTFASTLLPTARGPRAPPVARTAHAC